MRERLERQRRQRGLGKLAGEDCEYGVDILERYRRPCSMIGKMKTTKKPKTIGRARKTNKVMKARKTRRTRKTSMLHHYTAYRSFYLPEFLSSCLRMFLSSCFSLVMSSCQLVSLSYFIHVFQSYYFPILSLPVCHTSCISAFLCPCLHVYLNISLFSCSLVSRPVIWT